MGQSQLLLIVLGVIIAGTAVIVGMNLFHASAVQSNRDGLDSDLLRLANQAQTYYKKTEVLGGGNRSFIGFDIPSRLASNENGTYTTIYARADQALLQGVGKETADLGFGCEGGAYITHRILVYPDSVRVQRVY